MFISIFYRTKMFVMFFYVLCGAHSTYFTNLFLFKKKRNMRTTSFETVMPEWFFLVTVSNMRLKHLLQINSGFVCILSTELHCNGLYPWYSNGIHANYKHFIEHINASNQEYMVSLDVWDEDRICVFRILVRLTFWVSPVYKRSISSKLEYYKA